MHRTPIGTISVFATLALAITFLVNPSRPADAVVIATWSVDTYSEFDSGEATDAFITSLGEVKRGWTTKSTDLEFGTPWAALRASDGTIYIGSDKGSVYAMRADKATKVVELEDAVAVVSLALAADGSLYAGTMPSGTVWKVDTVKKKASKLVTLEGAETVWSLALGTGDKKLYAGTGPEGKLFSIDIAAKKAEVAFDTEDKRVMSVIRVRDGSIWFGTSDKALLFRHDPKKNRTRAMADFAGNEITALAEAQGGVIAAANDLKEPSTTDTKTKSAIDTTKSKKKPGQEPKMPKAGTKPGADKTTPSGSEVTRKDKRKGKGALWRVRGDGQLEQIHALTDTYFTSIAVNANGHIFAGAGDKGRIYVIDLEETVSTALDVEQRMIAQVIAVKGGIVFTTADASALYRTTGKASSASYKSKVFDSKAPSRFGKVVWRGTNKLKLETRSGNTEEPGNGWSKWQAPKKVSRASGGSFHGSIVSPPGRYLQYRVQLGGAADSTLRSTKVYYLPQNKATRVDSVTIEDGTKRTKLATMKDGAAKPRSPILKIKWEIDNDDEDETVYKISVRREGEVRWRKITTDVKPLTKTEYEWNTETFPDGYYRLRVTASDRLSNTSDRALEWHKTTALFLVDNERPRIDGVSVKYPSLSARSVDSLSAIAEMAYSVDDGPWMVGGARDGLFDELSELLTATLEDDLPPGLHTVSIRVADEAGNIGSASITFRVGR